MRSFLAGYFNLPANKGKTQIKINHSKNGPGYFDEWLMREGVDDCWQQIESVPSNAVQKK